MWAATTIVFWLLWIVYNTLRFTRLMSTKEKASFGMVLDFFGFLNQLFSHESLVLKTFMMLIWAVLFALDYFIWKHSDDDDGPKKRRRAWVKNKLPKPVTKKIPVPI